MEALRNNSGASSRQKSEQCKDGLLFSQGTQSPARYRDGVFITFHGSWKDLDDRRATELSSFRSLEELLATPVRLSPTVLRDDA